MFRGILNDKQIRDLAEYHEFISPFEPKNIRKLPNNIKTLSFGTSSYGYDFTLAEEIYMFQVDHTTELNVKEFDMDKHAKRLEIHEDEYGRYVVLPPHSFVLGHTEEYVKMPEDVLGICFDKSTYARIGGVQTNVTPIEPEWEGQITLEIRNTLPCFTRLYVGEGIIQTIFIRGERPEVTYADKKGKYQGQQRVTSPRL